MRLQIVLAMLAMPALCEAAADSTLEHYIDCDGFAGGVRAVMLDRRPKSAEPWREVGFGGKQQRVSVIDGYRVTYSYARKLAFAILWADRSEPARDAEDKAAVIKELANPAWLVEVEADAIVDA